MYSSQTFYSRSLNKFKPNSSYNFNPNVQKHSSTFFGTKPLLNASYSSSYAKPLSSFSQNHFETDLPSQLLSMIENEDSNISRFKRKVEAEKKKIEEDFYHFKKQIDHLIDDSKLSLQAQLDQLYVGYMEKYAFLKNQIQELRMYRKQILADNSSSSHLGNLNKIGKSELIRQIQEDMHYSRQQEARSYIGQIQKSRMDSINSLTDELIVIDSFTIPLYNKENMLKMMDSIKISLSDNLHDIHQNKNLVNTIEIILQRGLEKDNQMSIHQSRVVKQQTFSQNVNLNHIKSSFTNFFNEKNLKPQSKIEKFKQNKVKRSFQNENIIVPLSQKNNKAFESQLNESFQGTSHFINPFQNSIQRQQFKGSKTQKQTLFMSRISNISNEGHIQVSSNQQGFITDEKLSNLTLTKLGTFSTDHKDSILCAVFVDGQIATGSKDKTINIYDMQGRKLKSLKGHESSICCMSVIKNQHGEYLATGSDHGCSSLIFWNPQNWNMKFKKQYHSAALSGIIDTEDNIHVVTTSYDKKVCLFNYLNGQIDFYLNCYNSPIIGCAMTANADKIITISLDKAIGVIGILKNYNKVESLQAERTIYCEALPCSLQALMSQPKRFAIGTKDGRVLVYQTDNGKLISQSLSCDGSIVSLNLLQSSIQPYQLALSSSIKSSGIAITNLKQNKTYSLPIEGKVNLEFGCGIGPKVIFDNYGRVLIVSQNANLRQFSIYKINKNVKIDPMRPSNF